MSTSRGASQILWSFSSPLMCTLMVKYILILTVLIWYKAHARLWPRDVYPFPPYVSLSFPQLSILNLLSRKHRSSQLSTHQSLSLLLPSWTEMALPALQRHGLLSWERKWSCILLYKCNHIHWLSLLDSLALQVGCVAVGWYFHSSIPPEQIFWDLPDSCFSLKSAFGF